MKSQSIKIMVLYIILGAGGVWHYLGLFETLMSQLAAPFMITLAGWITWESVNLLGNTDSILVGQSNSVVLQVKATRKWGFLLWCFIIALGGYLLEVFAVHSGIIFGQYEYNVTLQPVIFGVPIVIGAAWLSMLLVSAALVQRLLSKTFRKTPYIFALLTAGLMVLFDAVMEPAAVKLNYWHWENSQIPLQNYAAWFVIGAVFAWSGIQTGLLKRELPKFAMHAYFAQLLYFSIAAF